MAGPLPRSASSFRPSPLNSILYWYNDPDSSKQVRRKERALIHALCRVVCRACGPWISYCFLAKNICTSQRSPPRSPRSQPGALQVRVCRSRQPPNSAMPAESFRSSVTLVGGSCGRHAHAVRYHGAPRALQSESTANDRLGWPGT